MFHIEIDAMQESKRHEKKKREFHGQRSLASYSPRGREESDTTQ